MKESMSIWTRRAPWLLRLGVGLAWAGTYSFGACTWGWAPDNCRSVSCPLGCTPKQIIGSATFCSKQGILCCQCEMTAWRCTDGGKTCVNSCLYEKDWFADLSCNQWNHPCGVP